MIMQSFVKHAEKDIFLFTTLISAVRVWWTPEIHKILILIEINLNKRQQFDLLVHM